jgi:hypothetical protein
MKAAYLVIDQDGQLSRFPDEKKIDKKLLAAAEAGECTIISATPNERRGMIDFYKAIVEPIEPEEGEDDDSVEYEITDWELV